MTAEAPTVRLIFDIYARERMWSTALAQWLNAQGHRTRSGRLWSAQVLLKMLRNSAYIGRTTWRDSEVDGEHDGIIEPALFDAAQALMRERGEDMGKRSANVAE
jgi:hypothetical protein